VFLKFIPAVRRICCLCCSYCWCSSRFVCSRPQPIIYCACHPQQSCSCG